MSAVTMRGMEKKEIRMRKKIIFSKTIVIRMIMLMKILTTNDPGEEEVVSYST